MRTAMLALKDEIAGGDRNVIEAQQTMMAS